MTRQAVHLETQDQNARRLWARPAKLAALVATGFVVAVLLIMADSYLRERRLNPLTIGEIEALQVELIKQPGNEQIKNRIRQIDMEVRHRHFYRRALAERGAYLLLGGIVVLLIGAKTSLKLTTAPYTPDPNVSLRSTQGRMAAMARRGIVGFGLVMGGVLLAIASLPKYRLPEFAAAGAGPVIVQRMTGTWPAFRGATGSGVVTEGGDYPTEWDGPTGKNVIWKAKIDLPGHSSPVVWENRVFLTGASQETRAVYCFDAATGASKWKQPVGLAGSGGLELGEASGGYAPNTAATDGQRVYAIFPTGDVAAFDFAGQRVWAKNLGLPKNTYGHTASLILCKQRLIVQLDEGNVLKESNSALIALDAATGNEVWRTKRDTTATWSTPIVITLGNTQQIVCSGLPHVAAYDPDSGKEIWRVKCMEGEVTPTPIFAAGMVFVCNERAELAAIKPDGKGNVTATHVAWKMEDNLPDIVSPLSNGQLVWMVKTSGLFTCVDVKDGKMVYEKDLDEKEPPEVKASPVLLGERIYLLDLKGVMHLLEAGREFKVTGKAAVGEECNASPAFAGGRIYIRGKEHLYCIGKK